MQIFELPDKEFKNHCLKDAHRKRNEIDKSGKTMHKRNEKVNEETETIKNQILQLKYMIIKKFTRTVQEKP